MKLSSPPEVLELHYYDYPNVGDSLNEILLRTYLEYKYSNSKFLLRKWWQ